MYLINIFQYQDIDLALGILWVLKLDPPQQVVTAYITSQR